MRHKIFISILLLLLPFMAKAQIGDHRDDLSLGVNGGMVMTNVGFSPKVNQSMLQGMTFGISCRYVCEKYFSSICSIYTELNYTQMGWKEKILDYDSQPVINTSSHEAERYERKLGYLQLPIMAHLAWGREVKGVNFFIEAGPQFGYLITDKENTNFTRETMNLDDRANQTYAQDTMAIKNKFDYGICAGLGLEFSHPKVGHFIVEGRYYYGLGNLYGAKKSDYFSKSNQAAIEVKLTYLFDIVRTKGAKRK